jgi:hypothetical protein
LVLFIFKEHVSIHATESNKLRDKNKFTAIINGFNLKVKDGSHAKKLGHLDIDISSCIKSLQHIEFDISGNVMMSCASTECDLDEPVFKPNNVDYGLVIHYLLIASPVSLQFKVGQKKSCDWTATQEFPNNKSSGRQHKKGKSGSIPGPGSFGCI